MGFAEGAHAPGQAEDGPEPSLRVLVVDDEDDTAALLARGLSAHGHQVETTGMCRDVLEMARRFLPDVVLLDIGLPDGDGCDLARELKHEHGDDMSLIALSGYLVSRACPPELQLLFDKTLLKPVSMTVVLRAITACRRGAEANFHARASGLRPRTPHPSHK